MVLRQDFDGVVAAVGAEIGGLVRQRILTAQLILDCYEGVGYIIELKWKESVTPGGVCNALQDFVPGMPGAGDIGLMV